MLKFLVWYIFILLYSCIFAITISVPMYFAYNLIATTYGFNELSWCVFFLISLIIPIIKNMITIKLKINK